MFCMGFSGDAILSIIANNQRTQWQPRSIVFFGLNEDFQLISDDATEVTMLYFNAGFYCLDTHDDDVQCNGTLFNTFHDTIHVPAGSKDGEDVFAVALQMESELKQPGAMYELLHSLMKILLLKAVRLYEKQRGTLNLQQRSTPDLLHKFKLVVEKEFRKLHYANDYAELLAVSLPTLGRAVKEHLGIIVTEFVQQRLISESEKMLTQSEKAVKEIAFELGFHDEHYFSRVFKKAKGMSPTEYRHTAVQGAS